MKILEAGILVAVVAATILGAAVFVTSTMNMQPVYAIIAPSCQNCAKDFAPGQEAENPGGAEDFAPGHCIGCEPNDVAPGELKKKQIE
jgi:hypothetical protein